MGHADMSGMDIHLRIQALADNELPEEEIPRVLAEIQGSYEYRDEYAELLRLKRKLAGAPVPEPRPEWFLRVQRSLRRRVFGGLGVVAFVGSYAGLLLYAVITVVRRNAFPSLVLAALAVGGGGLLVLLVLTIADRIRESRDDKYRGVEK
jgi:hypothetical protein